MIGRIAGAVMGGIGSLLGSKGEEGRGKDFFKSVAKGAITGPVGTGLLKGVKERREINQAEEEQNQAMNAFMANQPMPVDLNQGNPGFISPQQTPGTNGTAPANPTFNQGEYDKFNAIANQNYGAMFAPSQS